MNAFITEYALNAVRELILNALDEADSTDSIGCMEMTMWRYTEYNKTLRVRIAYTLIAEDGEKRDMVNEFNIGLHGDAYLTY